MASTIELAVKNLQEEVNRMELREIEIGNKVAQILEQLLRTATRTGKSKPVQPISNVDEATFFGSFVKKTEKKKGNGFTESVDLNTVKRFYQILIKLDIPNLPAMAYLWATVMKMKEEDIETFVGLLDPANRNTYAQSSKDFQEMMKTNLDAAKALESLCVSKDGKKKLAPDSKAGDKDEKTGQEYTKKFTDLKLWDALIYRNLSDDDKKALASGSSGKKIDVAALSASPIDLADANIKAKAAADNLKKKRAKQPGATTESAGTSKTATEKAVSKTKATKAKAKPKAKSKKSEDDDDKIEETVDGDEEEEEEGEDAEDPTDE